MPMKKNLFLIILFLMSASLLAPLLAKEKHIPLDLAVIHNNQGVSYLNNNDMDHAEIEFKSAVELDPLYPEAHNNLGLIYKFKGYYEKAIVSFNKAAQLKYKWATPYNHLGTVYLAMDELDKAVTNLKKATVLDKKYADAYYNLGIVYLEKAKKAKDPKQDWASAVKAFQQATTIDTHLFHAHMDLADTYRKQGEIEKAILRYRMAIETNPRDPTAWEHLGDLYKDTGDTKKAEECYAKVKLLDPMSEEKLIKLGEEYVKRNFSDAMQLYQRALEMNPNNSTIYFDMGYAYTTQGRHVEAIQAYQKAISLKPDFLAAYFNMGLAMKELHDYRNAIAAFQHTLKIQPHHSEALYQLGELFSQTENPQWALQAYCQFLFVAKSNQEKEKLRHAQQEANRLGGCRTK